MLLRVVSDFRRAMDLSLVLDEEGIGHELGSAGDGWTLTVDDADAERAAAALDAFERENPPPSRRPPPARDWSGPVAGGLVLFLGILAFQVWTGPDDPANEWFRRGSADAAAIVHGEWWRTVTALTLHADAGHAAGNALLGGLLLALLAGTAGTGTAAAAVLLSGVLGTLGAAELLRRNFVSIGASTAVFGALGALAPLARSRRAWIPVASGLALLGFLGTSKRADLAGHLCGFAAGLLLGLVLSRLPRARSRAAQVALGLLALAVPVLAWLRAFGMR